MISAAQHLCELWPLCLLMLGTSLGILVGAVPGLTGAMLIALTLPLTHQMDYPGGALDAMILLVSMYVGSISGGLISATLLRMPGTPASMMTTLDGYPLAQRGQPARALGLGISASFVGGLVSWVFLVLLSKPMADWSTKLGPFEFFALVLMALMLIASVSGNSMMRGVFSGLLGAAATLPGATPATGEIRWTFGYAKLADGLSLLPVLIGLFAISQVIKEITELDSKPERLTQIQGSIFMSWRDWKQQAINLTRSSLIGTVIGILPGIGANIGSVVAYSAAKNLSKRPEEFGAGAEDGIVASEAANNATVGGALIPLVAMGIPGSVIDAILLGALVIHGLQPGPLLFAQNADVVYTIMITMFAANLFMFGFMLLTTRWIARLVDVPKWMLLPTVVVFCIVGAYALNYRWFDVWVMLAFGLAGYGLERLKVPLAPFVIGFVLTPLAEERLCQGLMASGGSYVPLVTSPICLTLLIISAALLALPLLKRKMAGTGLRSIQA